MEGNIIILCLLTYSFCTAIDNNPRCNREQLCKSEPSWKRITDTAEEHHSITPQIVFGSIPADIKGSAYKNGAGRIKVNDDSFYGHWFDGDGMVSLLKFNGNGEIPVFTSKYIETDKYQLQRSDTHSIIVRGAWTQTTYWYHNLFKLPLNPSNTNLLHFNHKLFSICEGGLPVQIHPHTLNTINNKYTFGGQLHSFFSAHPKVYFHPDLDTNILINIGISIAPPSPAFNLYVYAIKEDSNEDFIHTNIIQLPYNCLVHDFVITNRYIVILVSPYVISNLDVLKSIVFAMGALGNYQQWKAELGSFVYVLDKYTLDLITVQKVDAISYWHWINGYDENQTIYTRLLAFPADKRSELEHRMKHLFNDDTVEDVTADLFGGICGLNIHMEQDGSVETEVVFYTQLNEKIQPFELLDINVEYSDSKLFRYLYTNSITEHGLFLNALQKVDLQTNSFQVYSDSEGDVYLSSPLYMPSSDERKKGEDEGYVLCYGYSVSNHNSLIYLFNASNISQPLTVMQLDFHVPLLFHGIFVGATSK